MNRNKELKTTKCVCGKTMKFDSIACSDCRKDLFHGLFRRLTPDGFVYSLAGKITLERYIEALKKKGIGPGGKCCFCGKKYVWYGHNPRPVTDNDEDRCCAQCNDNIVVPARITELQEHIRKTKETNHNQEQ